ncbi:MAG TPA: DUF3035 domain-containing protein [Dongiaceae bacterium]
MRRKTIALTVSVVAAAALLAGCQATKKTLGLTKRSPDEFRVVSRAPLSLPPDYNLRPPTPGAPRPQEGTARDQAKAAVFGTPEAAISDKVPPIGESAAGSASSAGESALLQSAGISGVNPNIRTLVDSETDQDQADSVSLADELTFWRAPQPYGTVVDPTAEQKRLQENAALGKPATEGDTPVIERKKRGLLEGIF